ncbi:MAG: hypothetical protein AAFY65_13740 [Pseudomonadota bacterium]
MGWPLSPRLGLLTLSGAVLLSGCMPTGPDARRNAYLDCARDQGLTVSDGTILTRSPADLERLNRCEALPR